MDRIKGVKPVFLASFMLGIILIFATALVVIDRDPAKADGVSGSGKLSVGQVSRMTAGTYENEREVLLAEGAGNDTNATSRGDEYRLLDKNIVSQIGLQRAASAAAEPTAQVETIPVPAPAAATAAPAATTEPAQPAPVKSAAAPAKAAEPAAPAKTAAKPAAAPAKAPATAPAKPASGYAYNLDLLSRLIMAEAQGEPYEAQVGVGAVVMNRVKSGVWANTIKGVIYQKTGGYYQFTPVVNGWIDKPADQQCIAAAKDAMNGVDPTNGAQFYYDDKVTNQWILAKPVSVQFGHMVFAF